MVYFLLFKKKVYDSIIRLEVIDENVFAAIPDVLFKIVLPACACSIFNPYNNFSQNLHKK